MAVLPGREDRAAAAFVAATAHKLAANADRELSGSAALTHLSDRSVSSDIAAMLLFMVAEAMADAAEMARSVWAESEDEIESALIIALRDLAFGRLSSLTDRPIPPPDVVSAEHGARTANSALYRLILQDVHALARQLLDPEPDLDPTRTTLFERARSLSLGAPSLADQGIRGVVSAFPGPHHLASLLLSVSRDIPGSAVAHIDPPPGLDHPAWTGSMRRMAKSRPILGPNHREAV
ncbi:MAG: helicase, partial [Chloroflexi bacterium]|nr:helicase [Chloroflexota bacterium]